MQPGFGAPRTWQMPPIPPVPGYGSTGNYRSPANSPAMGWKQQGNVNSALTQQQQLQALLESDFYISQQIRERDIRMACTRAYRQAYSTLITMNPDSFSLTMVQFLVENAYYDNLYDLNSFDSLICFQSNAVRRFLKQEGLPLNNTTLNYGIQQLFRRSLTMYDRKGRLVTLRPLSYDFNDYKGENDYSQLFTLKLLLSGKGQCNSMPRLYLMIAEKLGAQAYLSLGPQHSFIQYPDARNRLVNFETTNGTVVTTNWLMQSGYINAHALKMKTYLDTLSRRELFARSLCDLMLGYVHKFGYDELAEEIRQKILQIDPQNLTALIVGSNLKTQESLDKYIAAGKPPLQELDKYPAVQTVRQEMLAAYEAVDRLGYQDMPAGAYQRWLGSIEQEKKQRSQQALQQSIQADIDRLRKIKVTITQKKGR
jgi:hypothetical protein